ncbi:MAG TPA: hypothetical protein VNP04_32450 [Alphaproteobacteria bacterium]|nr:hypothetical protein [Alphaproteobacteria bacterium]
MRRASERARRAGEVHNVEIGVDGVDYQMWVPLAVPAAQWEGALTDEHADPITTNLAVPAHKDRGNAHFLEDFLSADLPFHTRAGPALDREGLLLGAAKSLAAAV